MKANVWFRKIVVTIAVAAGLLLTAGPATADLYPDHLSTWGINGYPRCDYTNNLVHVDGKALTFGSGSYRFRYGVYRSDGSRIAFSPLYPSGTTWWNLNGNTWYAMPSWSEAFTTDIPAGSELRAFLIKWNGSYWQTVAWEGYDCTFQLG